MAHLANDPGQVFEYLAVERIQRGGTIYGRDGDGCLLENYVLQFHWIYSSTRTGGAVVVASTP